MTQRDTWPSAPPPSVSVLPRACTLEVTTRVVRPRWSIDACNKLTAALAIALYLVTLGVWAALLWGWL